MAAYNTFSTSTSTHLIEISDGTLTIGEYTFPDNCVSLSVEETELVLDALMIWRYGLQALTEEDDAA